MNNQISPKVSEILARSKEEAVRLNNKCIEPEHLLLGFVRDEQNKARNILLLLNVNLSMLKAEVEQSLSGEENSDLMPEEVTLSEKTTKILRLSLLEARMLKAKTADVEHILLAIMKENNNNACRILQHHHVSYQELLKMLAEQPDIRFGFGFPDEEDDEEDEYPSHQSDGQRETATGTTHIRQASNDTPVLDTFGTDLTRAATEGVLDPVIGREKEIERVAQILTRRKKNNPILIGEPGVGKSAIVEGLALRIVQRKAPRILFDKRIIALDMAAVVAGTKYRGQFEERIRSILAELKKNPNVVLFIDEIHTIIGAGSAPGSMDAANMLKPALARGEIQCIGATTTDEFRKTIEKDGALERRFQKIIVEPTTQDETILILQQIKDRYEDHHNVRYTDQAIRACVILTERYVTDRCFPDKAIDALDEAGSRIHIKNNPVSHEIEEQEQRVREMHDAKNEAVKNQNFELAADYRDKEVHMNEELTQMKNEWEAKLKLERATVDEEQIAETVAIMTGIPLQRLNETEETKLKNMPRHLKQAVIGQDEAIDTLTRSIRRGRLGLKDPNKPVAVFMFLGPTGVGKTYLAKKLAEYMFGSTDALIRIDMSEYMEKHTVSRMVGAPPGYVGHEEGGQLTEKIRRKPYSILLLDEMEKAHPDVFNILLQVMDEGRLTDSNGTTVSFKNTIIIMTSNCGTRQLKDFGNGIGFTTPNNTQINKTRTREVVEKAIRKQFAPEFLNRLDDIIHFAPLTPDDIKRIVDIELTPILSRINEMGYTLTVDDSAKNLIAQKGYDVQFGARPLRRAIQTLLEDALSELLLDAKPPLEAHIIAQAQGEKITVTYK